MIKKEKVLELFTEVVNGKTLKPKGDDYNYIKIEIVPNAWKNEQDEFVEGPIIKYRYHGSSAIQVNYKEFKWLLEVIFNDVEEFDVKVSPRKSEQQQVDDWFTHISKNGAL